ETVLNTSQSVQSSSTPKTVESKVQEMTSTPSDLSPTQSSSKQTHPSQNVETVLNTPQSVQSSSTPKTVESVESKVQEMTPADLSPTQEISVFPDQLSQVYNTIRNLFSAHNMHENIEDAKEFIAQCFVASAVYQF